MTGYSLILQKEARNTLIYLSISKYLLFIGNLRVNNQARFPDKIINKTQVIFKKLGVQKKKITLCVFESHILLFISFLRYSLIRKSVGVTIF